MQRPLRASFFVQKVFSNGQLFQDAALEAVGVEKLQVLRRYIQLGLLKRELLEELSDSMYAQAIHFEFEQ